MWKIFFNKIYLGVCNIYISIFQIINNKLINNLHYPKHPKNVDIWMFKSRYYRRKNFVYIVSAISYNFFILCAGTIWTILYSFVLNLGFLVE